MERLRGGTPGTGMGAGMGAGMGTGMGTGMATARTPNHRCINHCAAALLASSFRYYRYKPKHDALLLMADHNPSIRESHGLVQN